MQFLLDVHLSYKLVNFLRAQGHGATHVNTILDQWRTPDPDICRYADEHSLIVLTKDADFRNSFFVSRTPRQLVRIVLGNIPNNELITLLAQALPDIEQAALRENFYVEVGRSTSVYLPEN